MFFSAKNKNILPKTLKMKRVISLINEKKSLFVGGKKIKIHNIVLKN